MKILFINPPVFNDIGRVLANTPPLGLLYLGAFLEKNGYADVKIFDADAAGMTWDDLKIALIKENPDIVGITGPSFVLPAVIKTAEIARKNLPNCVIVTGGFGSTKEPEKILKAADKAVNFVVMGEGEITFLELVKKIENKADDFGGINGISFLDQGGNLTTTEPRDYIKDLDSLPWPAYHLLYPEFSKYRGMQGDFKEMSRPIGIVFASRGCPHRCAFCSLGSKMYRARNPKDIVAEMEFYKDEFHVKSIQIYDDEFIGLSPKQNEWIKELCGEIIKKGLHKSLAFLVQGRCSQFVNLEILKTMREANIVWIWWGVESGSQKILDSINKDIKLENVVRDFALAREAGIKSLMFIMIGFPGETPADIKLTAKIIKRVKPDTARIHIVSPYPGSALRKYLEDNNLLNTADYYKFDTRNNVIHHTKEMTAEEIKKYYRLLVFKFESGYWYFAKFFAKSLITFDGWKQFFRRGKMITNHFAGWLKVNSN